MKTFILLSLFLLAACTTSKKDTDYDGRCDALRPPDHCMRQPMKAGTDKTLDNHEDK